MCQALQDEGFSEYAYVDVPGTQGGHNVHSNTPGLPQKADAKALTVIAS